MKGKKAEKKLFFFKKIEKRRGKSNKTFMSNPGAVVTIPHDFTVRVFAGGFDSPQRPFFLNAIEAIRPLMAAKGMDLTLVVEYHYVQEMRLLQWSPDDLVNWLEQSDIFFGVHGCEKHFFLFFPNFIPFFGENEKQFFFIFGSWVFWHSRESFCNTLPIPALSIVGLGVMM